MDSVFLSAWQFSKLWSVSHWLFTGRSTAQNNSSPRTSPLVCFFSMFRDAAHTSPSLGRWTPWGKLTLFVPSISGLMSVAQMAELIFNGCLCTNTSFWENIGLVYWSSFHHLSKCQAHCRDVVDIHWINLNWHSGQTWNVLGDSFYWWSWYEF